MVQWYNGSMVQWYNGEIKLLMSRLQNIGPSNH